jgi:AAA domain
MAVHNQSLPGLQALAGIFGGEVSNGQVRAPGPGHSAEDRSMSIRLDPSAPDGFLVNTFSPADDPIACKDYVRQKLGIPFKPNGSNGSSRHRASNGAVERALMAAVSAQGRKDKPSSDKPAGKLGKVVATYDYTDSAGELLYQSRRFDPKTFRLRRPDGNGGWIPDLDGIDRRVLYRWPELLKYPSATVFVTEGESDADRVASLGHCATTVASGKWTPECVQALAGRDVVILQDNDKPGVERALEAAQQLHGTAASVRVVLLPDLPPKGDVSDWLDADPQRAEKLVDVCMDTPEWVPDTSTGQDSTADRSENIIQSSGQFTRNYSPPDYLVDGFLQRRYCYSFTARTGGGKTALALLLAAHVGLGLPLGDREVDKGRVLIFAGENPDDVRARWIAMGQQMNFDLETIDVHFVPGRFKISELIERIRKEMEALGGAALLIIDTSAAYFEGDDENDNVQLGAHASRMRELRIPGGPCTIINCHPTKNAADDNLIPRGGGAFLNEVDGNLAARKDDMAVELHWQGKFRGPEFAPMNFQLKTVTHERLKDSKGRLISTVIASCLSDQEKQEMAKVARTDENLMLEAIETLEGNTSLSDLARKLGWLNKSGVPLKPKAHRVLGRLKRAKLITEERGELTLTEKGLKAIKKRKS